MAQKIVPASRTNTIGNKPLVNNKVLAVQPNGLSPAITTGATATNWPHKPGTGGAAYGPGQPVNSAGRPGRIQAFQSRGRVVSTRVRK
jgi:hypothetical protein